VTKIREGPAGRAKAAGLDRLEAKLEGIVQPRNLGLGHLVISIREDQIDLPFGQPGPPRQHPRDLAVTSWR
jgi:hypothetical protein